MYDLLAPPRTCIYNIQMVNYHQYNNYGDEKNVLYYMIIHISYTYQIIPSKNARMVRITKYYHIIILCTTTLPSICNRSSTTKTKNRTAQSSTNFQNHLCAAATDEIILYMIYAFSRSPGNKNREYNNIILLYVRQQNGRSAGPGLSTLPPVTQSHLRVPHTAPR